MLYEIRRYQTLPGLRSEWVQYMENVIIPLHIAADVTVVATFTDLDDDDGFVWIRAFPDEYARKAAYRAIYESDHWRTNVSPRVREFLVKDSTTMMSVQSTAKSPLDRHLIGAEPV
ncbi:NIPSNAP family protein [Microbacterium sp. A93]|uniref:NIPSNAP family protein n=1 Tax=Microbacterium sp. A93 TaxID=3450716 RepID=UPI003F41BC13